MSRAGRQIVEWRGGRVLGDVVAANVVRLRKHKGLNREQLADVCATRGYPSLTYGVIGSIETGRPNKDGRRTREPTVDEAAGLALALDVPLTVLLADPREHPTVPIGGHDVNTWSALLWMLGTGRIADTADEHDTFRRASWLVHSGWTVAEALADLSRVEREPDGTDALHRNALRRLAVALERIRAQGAPFPPIGDRVYARARELGVSLPGSSVEVTAP